MLCPHDVTVQSQCSTHHALTTGQNREERVVVLLDVNVQQVGGGQQSVAGVTGVAVGTVVVVFIAVTV